MDNRHLMVDQKAEWITLQAFNSHPATLVMGIIEAYESAKQSNKHSEKTRPLYNEKGQQVGSWGWEQPTQNTVCKHDGKWIAFAGDNGEGVTQCVNCGATI